MSETTTGPVGLVLARPARLLGAEPFFMEFIAGIEERLAERDLSLLLHVVGDHEAEIAAYRRWSAQRLVAATVVVNRTADDVRPDELVALKLSAVLVGEPGAGLAAVRTDDAGPVHTAAAHLLELGHRRIARVSGPDTLLHTRARTAALAAACAEVGIEPVTVEADYSERAGATATAGLLKADPRPTAILYDNDVMAVAGLGVAKKLGIDVPGQLSLIAWDDSTLCRLASPALTTMSVDVHQFGRTVADSVLELLADEPVAERWSPAARLDVRGSTGPVPAE